MCICASDGIDIEMIAKWSFDPRIFFDIKAKQTSLFQNFAGTNWEETNYSKTLQDRSGTNQLTWQDLSGSKQIILKLNKIEVGQTNLFLNFSGSKGDESNCVKTVQDQSGMNQIISKLLRMKVE